MYVVVQYLWAPKSRRADPNSDADADANAAQPYKSPLVASISKVHVHLSSWILLNVLVVKRRRSVCVCKWVFCRQICWRRRQLRCASLHIEGNTLSPSPPAAPIRRCSRYKLNFCTKASKLRIWRAKQQQVFEQSKHADISYLSYTATINCKNVKQSTEMQ